MTLDTPSPTRGAELRHGVIPLLGSTVGLAVGIGSLPLYSNSAVFVALEKENGWSASSVALVFLVANLAMAAVGPVWGRLLDRNGARVPVMIGGAALAASYLVLAVVPDNFAVYVVTQVLAYVLAVATASLAYARVVALSFSKMRGLAFGIMNTGPALIAMVLPAVTAGVIAASGLRVGFLVLGLIVLVGTGIALLLMPRTPREVHEARAAVAKSTPLRFSWPLALVMLAFFLAAASTIGLIEEMFALLLAAGTDQGTVIGLLGSIGLAMLVIRLVIGAVLDVLPPKWVAVTVFAIAALAVGSLALFGPAAALFAMLALGLALGSETDIMPMIISRTFPGAQFGRVFGFVGMAFGVGVAVGPFTLASVLDGTGSAASTALVAALGLAAVAVVFALLPRGSRETRPLYAEHGSAATRTPGSDADEATPDPEPAPQSAR